MQLKIFYDHGQTFKTVRFEDSITVQVSPFLSYFLHLIKCVIFVIMKFVFTCFMHTLFFSFSFILTTEYIFKMIFFSHKYLL